LSLRRGRVRWAKALRNQPGAIRRRFVIHIDARRRAQVRQVELDSGLKSARFLMVLASISPLFVIWAIQGSRLIPDRVFLALCASMVIVPDLFLYARFKIARRLHEKREIAVGKAEDHRDHLLVYLFAMLMPLYVVDVCTWRSFAGIIAALCFIVFLFWH